MIFTKIMSSIFDKETRVQQDNQQINKIIVGIHGINTKRSNTSWIDHFISYSKHYYKSDNVLYVDYEYGFLSVIFCVIPFVKNKLVKTFKIRLRKLQKQYPNASLNIVAHSYGTEMTHIALKSSKEIGRPLIKTDIVILVASILNVKTDLSKMFVREQFKEFHVYSSLEDEVCRFNPFGHSGYIGLYDNFATNHRYDTLEHGDYFTPEFFREWAKIFKLKEREL